MEQLSSKDSKVVSFSVMIVILSPNKGAET
jgi:hypothetical protein